MNAIELFVLFANSTLDSNGAARYTALAETKRGRKKILSDLNHKFFPHLLERSIIPATALTKMWDEPCYLYHSRFEFGAEFKSLLDAYQEVSRDDGWLIILKSGTTAVMRPEGRWDREVVIKVK